MVTFSLFLNDTTNVISRLKENTHQIFSKFNFIIGIFTLDPKFRGFYSDFVNTFCLCRMCVRRRQCVQV